MDLSVLCNSQSFKDYGVMVDRFNVLDARLRSLGFNCEIRVGVHTRGMSCYLEVAFKGGSYILENNQIRSVEALFDVAFIDLPLHLGLGDLEGLVVRKRLEVGV